MRCLRDQTSGQIMLVAKEEGKVFGSAPFSAPLKSSPGATRTVHPLLISPMVWVWKLQCQPVFPQVPPPQPSSPLPEDNRPRRPRETDLLSIHFWTPALIMSLPLLNNLQWLPSTSLIKPKPFTGAGTQACLTSDPSRFMLKPSTSTYSESPPHSSSPVLLSPNLSTRHFLHLECSSQSPLALHAIGYLLQKLPRLLLPSGKLATSSKPLYLQCSSLSYLFSPQPLTLEEHGPPPLTILTARAR